MGKARVVVVSKQRDKLACVNVIIYSIECLGSYFIIQNVTNISSRKSNLICVAWLLMTK